MKALIVIQNFTYAGGEILCLKIPSIRILDLVESISGQRGLMRW